LILGVAATGGGSGSGVNGVRMEAFSASPSEIFFPPGFRSNHAMIKSPLLEQICYTIPKYHCQNAERRIAGCDNGPTQAVQ
jgi:hypothetical protein